MLIPFDKKMSKGNFQIFKVISLNFSDRGAFDNFSSNDLYSIHNLIVSALENAIQLIDKFLIIHLFIN